MKNNRLSFSSSALYQSCAKAYEYHYIRRIRSTTLSAALLFGTAVDRASTAIFKPEADGKSPEQIFNYYWNYQEVNGKNTYLPRCLDIIYADGEWDYDLVTDLDRNKLRDEFGVVDLDEAIKKLLTWKKGVGYKGLPDSQKTFLNHSMHCVLKTKGLLMLEAIKTKIIPQLEEVLSVQEPIKIENEDGDSISGFVDLVARVKGYSDPVILDLKTSKLVYKDSCNEISPQLATYVAALEDKYHTRLAGFLVLSKQIIKNKKKVCKLCGHDSSGSNHKTCPQEVTGTKQNKKGELVECQTRCNGDFDISISPEVAIQIIISPMPEKTSDAVLENYDYVSSQIKNGIFPRSFNSCEKAWGLCPYHKYCFTGEKEGLIKLEERKSES